ncbi:MAG: alpha/beta fold hydrolase [Pseudobdellovibrionaceae bacterium]
MRSYTKQTGYCVATDGTPIYFEARGDGEPLIFVYGIGCLINHWHHQIEYFSQFYKVIIFDIRGHHKSSAIPHINNLTFDFIAADIFKLLEELEISQAHFVAHSFGASVLLKFFELYPDKVHSLCFINGFAKNPIKNMFGLNVVEPFFYFVKASYEKNPELWKTLWKMAIENPVSLLVAGVAGGFNLKLTHFKDIEVYARGIARMDLAFFFKLFEEMMFFDGSKILTKIDKPALIIAGEKDNVTPEFMQVEMHEQIRNSEYIRVPYGSHCSQLDFPDYINLRLESFLRKHPISMPHE